MSIEDQVDELIRHQAGTRAHAAGLRRPGSSRRPRASTARAVDTAAYLLLTDRGRVIVNTGMGFEAPHHKRVFDAIRRGPTHYIITTQGHVDHVGGVDLFREDGTTYVAQQNNQACQADDARIRALRMRTAGIWFDTLGTDARRIATENPGVPMRQAEPVPDITFDQLLELDVDGLRLELHAAVGETIDSAIVWLPERRTALISNLFGPLFPHFPNLNTLRGDRYRFVEPYLESVRTVRALRPEVLVTGRHDPIVGEDLIDASLARLYGAVDYVHQRALEGFNAGSRRLDPDGADPSCRPTSGRPGLREGLLGRTYALGELCRLVQAAVEHRALPRQRRRAPWRNSRTRPGPTPSWTGPRPLWPEAKPPWPSGWPRPSPRRNPTRLGPLPWCAPHTASCSSTAATSASGRTVGCATNSQRWEP